MIEPLSLAATYYKLDIYISGRRTLFGLKDCKVRFQGFIGPKVEAPIHDSIRELLTWECKEHGVKS